jgi:hypothetical protein
MGARYTAHQRYSHPWHTLITHASRPEQAKDSITIEVINPLRTNVTHSDSTRTLLTDSLKLKTILKILATKGR